MPIYAIESGKVIESAFANGGEGNYITILHANGYKSVYTHMANVSGLTVGTQVNKGARVGSVGMTGATTYPHVHLEIIDASGTRLNAIDLIKN